MKYVIFIILFISVSSIYAGGDSALARVKSIDRLPDDVTLVEIEWVKEKGFISNNSETKLRFHYQKWPNQSWFSKLVAFFYNHLERKYPKEKFDQCLNFLDEKKRNKEVFNLGQMGILEFSADKDDSDQIIIPYAELSIQKNGEPACLLYANPI